MLQFFQLDFAQVAEAGMRTRHAPTFPAEQLSQTLEPALRRAGLVREYERFHHNRWCLPLRQAHVRAWVKKVIFTCRPVIIVGGVEVVCSKPAPPPDEEEVARWCEHFLRVSDDVAHLVRRLEALDAGEREAQGKEDADRYAQVVALRRLLRREEAACG